MRYCILIFTVLFYGCNNNSSQSSTNQTYNQTTTNDISDIQEEPLRYTQWYLYKDYSFYIENNISSDANINLDKNTPYSGIGIKIAIIDDGFDINHPELKGRIYAKHNFSNVGTDDDISHTSTEDHHGTAVAGIIASNVDGYGIAGIAPNAQLILIKMPDSLSDDTLISMFNYAIEAGADVINCSWGTNNVSPGITDYLNNIAKNARDSKGIAIVFASGNENMDMSKDESAIKNIIGVGATDYQSLRTSYSNYGKELDIVAPGGGLYGPGITTIDPVGLNGISNDEYNRYNESNNGTNVSFIGTSASAPIVTGAIALMLEKNPNLTINDIFKIIQNNSDLIGENIPYIVDYNISNSASPRFYGTLGKSNYTNFKLYITSLDTNTSYGPYIPNIIDNNWSYTINFDLDEGFYSSSLRIPGEGIIATDAVFEINKSKNTQIDGFRNDFYGYGKLNISNYLNKLQ